MDILKWLENWFFKNCNGEWEKKKRLVIETIDNPGWGFTLQLEDSVYENLSLKKIIIDRTEDNWCHCLVRKNEFIIAGGPFNLTEIFNNFKCGLEKKGEACQQKLFLNSEIVDWMQKWYYQYCDEDWEHSERFIIKTAEYPGWYFSMLFEGTHCEGKVFDPIEIKKSEHDWYHCYLKKGRCEEEDKFEGRGGPLNLIDILNVFREWAEKCQKGKI